LARMWCWLYWPDGMPVCLLWTNGIHDCGGWLGIKICPLNLEHMDTILKVCCVFNSQFYSVCHICSNAGQNEQCHVWECEQHNSAPWVYLWSWYVRICMVVHIYTEGEMSYISSQEAHSILIKGRIYWYY
jgi:hypothetical protein